MRAEAGRNNFEVKFVDASGDNVWWFRRANYQFSGDWQQVRIKRRQIDFAWGTDDRPHAAPVPVDRVRAERRRRGRARAACGSIGLSLKPLRPQRAVPPPTARASSEASGNACGARHRRQDEHDVAKRANRGAATQTFEIDLKAVREFGGIEIDWARGLHAPRYSIETSLDGSRWKKVRSVDASNGGRDSHLMPESEARYIRLTMPDPGRDVGIAELYVRDLEFGASPNAFISSLAKQAPPRLLSAPVPRTSRSTGRSSASTATRRRACCPRTARSKSARAAFRSSRSSGRARAG